jgi:hypothetical protein
MMSTDLKKRILISTLVGLLIGLALSEVTFIFLGRTARPPQTIELTVPAGTSELVARGEQPPSLPEGMSFVVGDVLVIHNEDAVDHQLGPLWIPAGTSAQLALGQPESLAYECSFQADNYLGMDVYESLTLGTRIYGILFAGIPMGILIALYSAILPTKNKKHALENVQP